MYKFVYYDLPVEYMFIYLLQVGLSLIFYFTVQNISFDSHDLEFRTVTLSSQIHASLNSQISVTLKSHFLW